MLIRFLLFGYNAPYEVLKSKKMKIIVELQ